MVGSSIFQAPLYTNPSERNSDCTGSSNVITQPPSTIKNSVGYSPPQAFSNPSSENVGSPQIITQPKETLPVSKPVPKPASPKFVIPKLTSPKVGNQRLGNPIAANPVVGSPRVNTEQQPCTCGSPIVGSTNGENFVGFPSFTPLLMQFLGAHLGQPLLGIPQAIQTIGSTPGVGELVGAPATILKSFFGLCKEATPLASSMPAEVSNLIFL